MKNIYLYTCTCIVLLGCSKKSDNPQPNSPPPTTTVNNYPNKLILPTNLTNQEPQKGDGKVRSTYPSITTQNGKTIIPFTVTFEPYYTNQDNFGKFLGIKNQVFDKSFGWKTDSILIVNGERTPASHIGTNSTFFFNIDTPGIYWEYNNDSSTWDWGTWAMNNDGNAIAFDYDSGSTAFDKIWEIGAISGERMVITVYKDVTKDGKKDVVIMALNAYHLTNPNVNGKFNEANSRVNFYLFQDWDCTRYYPPNWQSPIDIYRIYWVIYSKGLWQMDDSYGLWLTDNYNTDNDACDLYITSATSKSQISITEDYNFRMTSGVYTKFALTNTTDTSNYKGINQAFDFQRSTSPVDFQQFTR